MGRRTKTSSSSKNTKRLKAITQNVASGHEAEVYIVNQNPLFIPEIIQCVFKYFKWNEIKSCRLVCQQWKDVGDGFLDKLTYVRFKSPIVQESVEKFTHTFQTAQTVPFNNFQFGNADKYGYSGDINPWRLITFLDFFEKWRNNLKELRMININLLNRRRTPLKFYNISPLLPFTLTKLRIQPRSSTSITISMDQIPNVKILSLDFCTLDIVPGVRLSLEEIDFSVVKFSKKGKRIEEPVLMNDLLDLNKLKKATLNYSNLILDLQGKHSFDYLSLNQVEVLNFAVSKWEIKDKFNLLDRFKHIELVKNEMMYRKSEFTVNSPINLSVLPKQLEELTLNIYDNGSISNGFTLTKLKYVWLEIANRLFNAAEPFDEYLNGFSQCSNLTELCVGSHNHSRLRTSSIPPSVKRICIATDMVTLKNDQVLEIDTLVLSNHWPTLNHNVLKGLRLKNLVWELDRDDYPKPCLEYKQDIMNILAIKFQSFVVGPFVEVSHAKFKKSYLFSLVHSQGKYYYFADGRRGIVISESAFNVLKKIGS